MYAAPHINLKPSGKAAIDAIIRKSFKTALGIKPITSNEALGQIGIHNAFQEMAQALRETQILRLSKTTTRRQVLRRMEITPHQERDIKFTMPTRVDKQHAVRPTA